MCENLKNKAFYAIINLYAIHFLKKGELDMWMGIFIAMLIIFIFWKVCWAIVEPIFTWIYESLINVFKSFGMSYLAARAMISIIVIIAVLILIAG